MPAQYIDVAETTHLVHRCSTDDAFSTYMQHRRRIQYIDVAQTTHFLNKLSHVCSKSKDFESQHLFNVLGVSTPKGFDITTRNRTLYIINRLFVTRIASHFGSVSTIFQLYRGGQFYWWRKPENPEKTTDLSQVTDKLYRHNVVSSTPRLSGVRTHNVSGDRHRLHWQL